MLQLTWRYYDVCRLRIRNKSIFLECQVEHSERHQPELKHRPQVPALQQYWVFVNHAEEKQQRANSDGYAVRCARCENSVAFDVEIHDVYEGLHHSQQCVSDDEGFQEQFCILHCQGSYFVISLKLRDPRCSSKLLPSFFNNSISNEFSKVSLNH